MLLTSLPNSLRAPVNVDAFEMLPFIAQGNSDILRFQAGFSYRVDTHENSHFDPT